MFIFASITTFTNYKENESYIMARPIRETPILFGEDARRFIQRMNEKRPDDPEKKRIRREHYEAIKKIFKG